MKTNEKAFFPYVCKDKDCRHVTEKLPENNKFAQNGDCLDGVYFNCACKTTIFIPMSDLKISEEL